MQNNGFKLDGRTIAIGVLVLIAAVVFLPRLLGGNNDQNTNNNNPAFNPPASNNQPAQNADIQLGDVVVTDRVDQNGCATSSTDSVPSTSDSFYVVAQEADVPQGTNVFVRLYRDNQPVEDLPPITADQDYQNTCIPFVFEVDDANGFDRGNYTAEFIINGNRADSVDFTIQ
jgi:cell division septation protein DedD